MADSNLVTGGAIIAVLATEAGKKLVTPVAEQLGLAVGDLAGIYRFYQNEALGKIFTKWAESRGDKPPLTQADVRKVLPLLPLASVQCDDDLQTRWAALLEHTVSLPEGILPSFGQTLSQLTADEARFLDRLYQYVAQAGGNGLRSVDHETLARIYDPTIGGVFKVDEVAQRWDKFGRLTQAELAIRDCVRLGILAEEQVGRVDFYPPTSDGIDPAGQPYSQTPVLTESVYSLSIYGLSFIRAVAA